MDEVDNLTFHFQTWYRWVIILRENIGKQLVHNHFHIQSPFQLQLFCSKHIFVIMVFNYKFSDKYFLNFVKLVEQNR